MLLKEYLRETTKLLKEIQHYFKTSIDARQALRLIWKWDLFEGT
jgi:hypothetical protein